LSTAKAKYLQCIQELYVPLFYREKYLDTVCDVPWDVVVYEENGIVTAAYVFMHKKKWGLSYIVQPQLCPYTGPLFFNPSNVHQAYSALLDQLPRHHLMIQDYFHDLPRLESSEDTFRQKYTNIIEASEDLDSLWKTYSSNHRRIIRKAARELKYEVEEDISTFLEFVAKTFAKRGKKEINEPSLFRKLDHILARENARKIVKCTDADDRVVAMCYFMIDENWTYNFANSIIEDYRHYGMNLIIWNEIKSTLQDGRSFDFEGSMIPGIDQFFARFKGKKIAYQSRYVSSNALVDFLVSLKMSKN